MNASIPPVPHVLALLIHWVRTKSPAAEALLSSDALLELGLDLQSDLQKRHVGSIEKMGDHLRNVANGLVNTEGQSLTEMATLLCQEWFKNQRPALAAEPAVDRMPVAETSPLANSEPADVVEQLPLTAANVSQVDDVAETDRLWHQVLESLRMELPGGTFDQWLRPTRAIALEGHTLRVAAPTEYGCFWIQQRQLGAVKRTLETIKGEPYEVQLVVEEKRPRLLDVSADKA